MAKSGSDWIEIADVAKPHGVRGELRVRSFSPDSDLIAAKRVVRVRLKSGEEATHTITTARLAPGDAWLVRLDRVEDRDAADKLRGAIFLVQRSEFAPLEEGEFYFCDLEGAEVLLDERPFGKVKSVKEYPSVNVLLVDPIEGGGAWEVPITDAFVTDLDADKGLVRLHNVDGCVRE